MTSEAQLLADALRVLVQARTVQKLVEELLEVLQRHTEAHGIVIARTEARTLNTAAAGLIREERVSQLLSVPLTPHPQWPALNENHASKLPRVTIAGATHSEEEPAVTFLPLRSPDGRVFGAFLIFTASPEPWNGSMQSALLAIADGVAATMARFEEHPIQPQLPPDPHASQTIFRLLAHNATDLVARHDLQGRYLYASPASRSLLGYDPEELIGRSVVEFLHPDDVDLARHTYAALLSSTDVHTVTYRMRRKDGEYSWLETTIRAVSDPHTGATQELQTSSRDISAKVNIEMELRDNEERFRLLVEEVQEFAIFALDPNGHVTSWNAGSVLMHGYSSEEIIGRHFSHFYPPEAIAAGAHKRELKTATEHGRFEDEGWRVRRDGSRFWAHVVTTAMRDGQGRLRGFSKVMRDMTKQQQATAALEEARQAAEQANRAKSDFLSRMSHELRTPLNAILGFGQLLETRSLEDKDHKRVTQILKAGRHLLGLINEVLDLARIEQGQTALSREAVNLDEVVHDALDLIRPLASSRDIRVISPDPPAEARYVFADRQRLKQVLLNLLSNAVKYNHDHGQVTITVHRFDSLLQLSVSDTGSGMPPEALSRLFIPFERLGAELSGIEGTGLGLSLSKGLVEAMGGAIEVTSEVGIGSTFTVVLNQSAPASPNSPDLRSASPVKRALRPSTIVYVEDNLVNLKLLQDLLAPAPEVRLLPATTGGLGLDLTRQHQPDLVLLDLHLPDLNGREVLARLKSDPNTQGIPVVILSADATPGMIKRLRLAGAHDYLSKPIDIHHFYQVVESLLGV